MRGLILFSAALACFAQSSQTAGVSPLQDAEKELFAARYKTAAQLYAQVLERDRAGPDAYYGLVRALIGDHRSAEAYAAAEDALRNSPQTAGAQTAAGLAAYRKGDLAQAESCFRAALRLDPEYAGALDGLASVCRAFSRLKTARDLQLAAYRKSPRDPELMIAHANTLKGAEHVAALREALSILDPESEQARALRAHIANDLAIGDRQVSRLTSPYDAGRIKLFRILDGPSRLRGIGMRVQLNRRQTLSLLLDTGASGISVSPKVAERAGLELLGDQSSETKGIGDERTQASYRYIVSELRIGDVLFADYPVSVFRAAQSPNYDGLIGADVFRRFVVTIDFPHLDLFLAPRPGGDSAGEPIDAGPLAAGFHRAVRVGDHLALPTFINSGPATLFLIDSGASDNLIDTAIGRQSSDVSRDDLARVAGIQGEVKQTSRAQHVTLAFGGFRQENPSLLAISLEKMSDSMGMAFGGILGMPVLGQLNVTIDYREGAVRLEHKK